MSLTRSVAKKREGGRSWKSQEWDSQKSKLDFTHHPYWLQEKNEETNPPPELTREHKSVEQR